MKPPHVLLIEDSCSDACLVQEILKDTGIDLSLTWLRDGEKVIEFFRSEKAVDLIMLDLNLPKVNGHMLMDFFNEKGIVSHTPILVLTGSTSPTDLQRTIDRGAIGYLIKPMTISEMEKMTAALKAILLSDEAV